MRQLLFIILLSFVVFGDGYTDSFNTTLEKNRWVPYSFLDSTEIVNGYKLEVSYNTIHGVQISLYCKAVFECEQYFKLLPSKVIILKNDVYGPILVLKNTSKSE